MKHQTSSRLIAAGFAATCAASAQIAAAAGFALIEQSGSGMGNAFAGAAATAEDASTVFFNPAGMSYLPGPQIVVAGHAVNLSTEFTNTGSSPVGGGNGGNAGDLLFVPNLYFAMPIGAFAFGIGANAPFGLATEYDSTWVGRFQGIKSELTTVNINPSVSYKINDMFSVGGGVNYQRTDVELTNAVALAPLVFGASSLKADDDAWGWNLGVIAQISPDMRVGFSYRSPIKYELEGNITVTGPTGAVVAPASEPARADVTFPDMFSVGVMQKFNDKWDFMGDITFTHWNHVDTIDVFGLRTGQQKDQLVLKLENSWRIAFGLNYHYNDRWTFKGGAAWDQSPVNDVYRTVRLPDEDRYWVSIGAKYRFNNKFSVDLGYAHLFVNDTSINQTRTQFNSTFTTTVRGDYEASVDLFSLQLTYTF